MATPSTKEVIISNKDIWPGYNFNESTDVFTPSKKGGNIDVEELPVQFKFNYLNKNILDTLMENSLRKSPNNNNYKWANDYQQEDVIDAIMVKGSKVLEKRGNNVQTDDVRHTVTSVLHKSCIDMLLFFSQKVASNCVEELDHCLSSILSTSKETFLPQSVSEFFCCAYIYHGSGNPGEKVTLVKHCLLEFCRMLLDSEMPTIPISALIKAPVLSHVESRSNSSITGEHHGMVFGSDNRNPSPVSLSFGERITPSYDISVNVNQKNHTLQASFQCSGIGHNNTSSLARKAIHDIKEMDSKKVGVGLQYNKNQETPDYISSNRSFKVMETNNCINSVDAKEANCKDSGMKSRVTIGAISHTVEQPHGGSSGEINIAVSVSPEKYKAEKNSVLSSGKVGRNDEKVTCNEENPTPNKNHGSNNPARNKVTLPTIFLEEHVNKTKSDFCHRDVNETQKTDIDKTCRNTSSREQNDNDNLIYHNQTNRIELGSVSEKGTESSTCTLCLDISQTSNKKENVLVEDEVVSSKRELSGENRFKSVSNELKNIKFQSNDERSKDKIINNKVKPAVKEIKNTKSGGNDESRGSNKTRSSKQMTARNKDIKTEGISEGRNYTTKGNHARSSQQSYASVVKEKEGSKSKVLPADDGDEKELLKAPQQSKSTTNKKYEQDKSKVLKSEYLKPLKTEKDQCGLERKYYIYLNEKCEEKVILLLGASGSGKTMLVNFVANYFTGKKSADDKLVHVETSAPTSAITAYTFCADVGDIPITIIDTPGLNDSSGSEVRDHVLSLKTFLANASSRGFEIHAIGFVAQAYLVRLTSSERLVMNYVSTMFGQSISNHLISLVTFADNQDTPPVVEAMKNYGVKSNVFLKFNNSALNNSKSEDIDDLDRAYWRICWRNWKKCLKTMRDLPALSINTMKAVQREVYAATVIDSAEKELRDEMSDFFSYCKEGKGFSINAGEVREKVWKLTAIIHRFRIKQNSALCTIDGIIIEYAVEACKMHNISPDVYVNYLLLGPTQMLVVSGSTVIRTISPLFEIAKRKSSRFHISKSISEWAYCHVCKQEHAMVRPPQGWIAKMISKVGQDETVIVLKCKSCKCPAELHGVSGSKSPLHCNELLDHTDNCIKKVLKENAFPDFPMKEKVFLEFLNKHLELKCKLIIEELLKRY